MRQSDHVWGQVHMSGTREIHLELKAGDLVEVVEVVRNPGEGRPGPQHKTPDPVLQT